MSFDTLDRTSWPSLDSSTNKFNAVQFAVYRYASGITSCITRSAMLMRSSTFALCFWYSLKMHIGFQISSAETLIV